MKKLGEVMLKRFSQREVRRIMGRLGVNTKEMPEVKEVIFRTSTKEITIQNPVVTLLEIQGQQIFQVVGEGIQERELPKEEPLPAPEIKISEEDILLVAQQANVDFEKAKKALEETKGDLAQAILMLTSKRS